MARLVRLLVYEGTAEWIKKTMEQNKVKSTFQAGPDSTIKSVVLGTLPDEVTILMEELNDERI